MFEVGFSEMLVCFLVALVVLGPEKLPKVARTVGRWTGQAKGYLRNLSAELDRETEIGELKRQLEEAKQAMRGGADSLRDTVHETKQSLHDSIKPDAKPGADDGSGKP